MTSGSALGTCSLVRHLLLVPSIQLDLQMLLLEKLPEYFDVNPECRASPSFVNDIAMLILSQFRWLDFVVDSNAFAEKLLEVLSICPLHLKKEIIGSLPEILGDQNHKASVNSLEQMLQEDSAIIVTVLDSLYNLNLDHQLQEQVITIALSCIRTIDAEQMPYLLRFLLLSASSTNARRIISRIREQLKFVRLSNSHTTQVNKLKGKLPVDNSEALILDTLRSSLQYKKILFEETLKELKSLEKAKDHKVIDFWLLVLTYMNGDSMQKNVAKLLKKKIIDGCIHEVLFDQCIQGNKALVQDYFPLFISLSAYLLACKEQRAREFGIHMYTCLFEELVDMYSRQEVLGALVTQVGSGINFEVSSALETMISLVTKYSQEMVQFSSYINGILDYLEGFSIENLHKVYEVFSHLALWARSTADSFGSSVGNELFMILRKQISNPDLKYKKMGIIGTLKIVSCLGDLSNDASSTLFQKSISDEALELLETCLECCKQLPLLWILFCDELITILDSKALHPTIMEWIGRYVGDFESMFLSDLESGQLPIKASYCDLEGELWMNLDGSISPVCLNILPLASSSLQSASPLIMLPAKFLLLSVLERLTNQGSLGGIDALLGCPLHLPSSKVLEIFFCSAAQDGFPLPDLRFLESLLNNYLKEWPLSLPELNFHADHSGSSISKPPLYLGSVEKRKEHMETHEKKSLIKKRKQNKIVNPSENSDVNGNVKQPTILDMFRKAGAVACQDVPNEGPYLSSSNEHTSEAGVSHMNDQTAAIFVEVSAVPKVLEAQKLKFRPLWVDCLNILDFPTDDSCCVDPAAELIIHLYLLRDLHNKLQLYAPASKQFPARCLSTPLGVRRMSVIKFLSELRPLYPNLRKHFNAALLILQEGADMSQEHWKVQSASAGNPDIPQSGISRSLVSISVCEEILRCFSKMLKFPEFLMDKSILSELLGTFQPVKIPDNFFSDISSIPNSGNIDYLYCGAYCFFEEILDIASSFSFVLASEVLFTLESLVIAGQHFFLKSLELNGKNMTDRFIKEIIPILHHGLGASAHKLLFLNGDNDFKSDLKSRSICAGLKLQKTVNVVVTLVNMCRTQGKVTVHAMAVKYCGKFVDCFLKDSLQKASRAYNPAVKELQKATRTVQAICSEAKGLRRTAITRKIPTTKRSMERFLFRVKALLHTTFWMGNLKHKDLKGQVVSSQAYVDQTENIDDDLKETCGEDEHGSAATEEDQETVQDCEENAVL